MEWERKDVAAAKKIKELIEGHTFTTFRGADIIPVAFSLQWLNDLIKYLEAEASKPNPPKEIKPQKIDKGKVKISGTAK